MRESIIKLIHQFGPPRLIPVIEQNIKESLLLRTSQVPEEQIPIGKAKIGGWPDLPDDIDWPVWQNKPLSFIAQLNLCDLPNYDFLNILPSDGVLSFFYSAGQETWGFDPKDKGSWQVIHFEDKGLQRRVYPVNFPNDGKYESCAIEYHRSITIPGLESPYIDLGYEKSNREELDKFRDLGKKIEEFLNEGQCINRLLGHPDQQQGDMQTECQLVSHGLYCGNSSGYKDPKAKVLKPRAVDWDLLLQIDSDDNTRMMWGDVGRIYYWIPHKDLRDKIFETTWMILQCG